MSADPEMPENYDRLGDVELVISAEIDRKTVTFESLLNLKIGSILELRRPTGENVDLYIEDVLLASGEILIIESALAIRIADLGNSRGESEKASG